MSRRRLALVGGRGYAGGELLRLLADHPAIELAAAVSRGRAGAPVRESVPDWAGDDRFIALEPAAAADVSADAWVLALPNGAAAAWVQPVAAAHSEAVIVDFSADFRLAADWVYGLTERHRTAIGRHRRIANPGCYATAAQLALGPLSRRLASAPSVFGVSGYSGAGRTPSARNDPARLAGNLVPYTLTGHGHEREIGHHLGHEVRFHPHVADFFRGISLTIDVELDAPADPDALRAQFEDAYGDEPGIRVTGEIPEIRDVVGTPRAHIGGFTVDIRDPRRVTLVVVIDNLLKGAASQALQNLNLALGLDEWAGMDPAAPATPEDDDVA